MKRVLNLLWLVLIPSLCWCNQGAGPKEIWLIVQKNYENDRSQAGATGASNFDSAMASLGDPVGNEDKASQELRKIARFVRNEPGVLRRLVERYGKPANPLRHVLEPPSLAIQDSGEDSRLAWEYIYLRPYLGGAGFARTRAETALQSINNSDSVSIIAMKIHLVTNSSADVFDTRKIQERWLALLQNFRNDDGLEAILECAEDIRARNASLPRDESRPWLGPLNVDRYLKELLVPVPITPLTDAVLWSDVIAAARVKPRFQRFKADLANLSRAGRIGA